MKVTIDLSPSEVKRIREFIESRKDVGCYTEGTAMWTIWQKVADKVEANKDGE